MTGRQALAELKRLGTAQNRKVYARHGVHGDTYGVSYANLGKLKKKIKIDHELAEKLWATGNHDARILATMIADPAAMKSSRLDAWVRDLDNYPIAGAFGGLVARTPFARKKCEKWIKSKSEWVGQVAWGLVGSLAMNDAAIPDAHFSDLLGVIERDIHGAKNRVRYAMNNALIAIGVRNPKLEKKAVAAAKRIGKVEVDHGETGCKTPDAAAYIRKSLDRKGHWVPARVG